MPLPQAAPEEGGGPRGEHFAYAATKTGARWNAYLAGPPQWVWCHEPKKTKPCVRIMTNGEVSCPWCGTDKPVKRKGYVPLYREIDNKPVCVLVSDLYEEVFAKLKLHDRVTVGKEGEKGDPVWITRALTQTPTFQTTLRHRFQPADLTDSLLRLWGCDELVRWYAEYCKRSDNTLSLKRGRAVHDDGRPVDPMLDAAAKRAGFNVVPDGDQGDGDEARAFLRAVQEGRVQPGGNGKHKPPKKG